MKPKTIVLTPCGQKDPNVIFGKSGDVSLAVWLEASSESCILPPSGLPLLILSSAPFLFQLDRVLYCISVPAPLTSGESLWQTAAF